MTKCSPLQPVTKETPKVLGALYQEPEMKTKYIFLIITHYHTGPYMVIYVLAQLLPLRYLFNL